MARPERFNRQMSTNNTRVFFRSVLSPHLQSTWPDNRAKRILMSRPSLDINRILSVLSNIVKECV